MKRGEKCDKIMPLWPDLHIKMSYDNETMKLYLNFELFNLKTEVVTC